MRNFKYTCLAILVTLMLENNLALANNTPNNFVRPIDGTITSVFSFGRIHPIFGNVRPHNGTDIANTDGTPIKASRSGKVSFSGWQNGYGYVVILDHGDSFTTLYAHQNQQPLVDVGETIAQGQTIGYVGSTGYATGPHVHFEIRERGALKDPYNFIPYNA